MDKSNDTKNGVYEEPERILDQFPKYHMNILLWVFNAKVGREDVFKPTIVNESLREIINDNGVRVINFVIWENLIVKNTMSSHRNVYKYK
jgi:hypothetical protein